MIKALFRFLTGGILDRALESVDRYIQAETDKEKIKGDLIKEHMRTRSSWLRAGGFWLLAMWSVLMLFHVGSVVVYSVLWCQGCAYPQDWTIAALPPPMDVWEGWIVLASIGGLGLSQMRR